ncbi:MAG: hypothetical protein Rubg2KO_16750 [Rubricoccaceae bacterium]
MPRTKLYDDRQAAEALGCGFFDFESLARSGGSINVEGRLSPTQFDARLESLRNAMRYEGMPAPDTRWGAWFASAEIGETYKGADLKGATEFGVISVDDLERITGLNVRRYMTRAESAVRAGEYFDEAAETRYTVEDLQSIAADTTHVESFARQLIHLKRTVKVTGAFTGQKDFAQFVNAGTAERARYRVGRGRWTVTT